MGANFSSEPVVEKHTERDHNDTFTAAVSSCQGWRMSQEDEHSLMLELPGEHKASFFAVFDGHGSGRVSKHASEALWRHITQNEMYIKGNFREALEESFLSFDREVNDSYNAQLAGTTAICVLIVDNVIYCANIGDSRAVASINCECLPLSQDHKPENPLELKRILAAGGYVLGNRVNGNLALSRAFGDFHYKSNEQLPAEQQIVCPCPDIKRIELNDDVDFIVLACDGIWDVLSSEEVVNFVISRLEQNVEPGLICEQLTTRCIAPDYELVIGCDNMTVLLICHTRGRNWEDYCTDIFEKHSKRLGVTRTRTFDDNFDNTFHLNNDRLLGSTEFPRANALSSFDRTFASTETSTDSDNSSSVDRSDDMGARDPVREILSVFDVLTGSRIVAGNNTSAFDETPPITEIFANDQHLTRQEEDIPEEDKLEANRTPKEEQGEEDEEEAKSQYEDTTTDAKHTDENQECNKEEDSDETKSLNTTEIHLSAPVEDEKLPAEIKPDDSVQVSDTGLDQDNQEQVHNTIEIQLGSPDEGEVTADNEIGETGAETAELNQDELPEVVNDEPQAGEQGEVAEEPNPPEEDESTDAKEENDDES